MTLTHADVQAALVIAAEKRGKAAFLAGTGVGANPYDYNSQQKLHRSWERGWCVAKNGTMPLQTAVCEVVKAVTS